MSYDTLDPQPYAANFVTLSNGNLTATGTSAALTVGSPGTTVIPPGAGLGVAQALESKTFGKWQVEVHCVTASGYDDAIGISGPLCMGAPFDSFGPGGFLGNESANAFWSTVSGYGYRQDSDINHGRIYFPGAYPIFTTGNPWGDGDRVTMYIDRDNDLLWFRKNGGVYSGTSNAGNPTSLTGGVPIWPGRAVRPGVSFAQGGVYTFNFGATPFTDSTPVGYSGWTNTGKVNLGSYLSNGLGGFDPGAGVMVSPYVAARNGPINSLSWPCDDSNTSPSGYGVIVDSDGGGGAPFTLLARGGASFYNGLGEAVSTLASTLNVVGGHKYYLGVFNNAAGTFQVGGNVADLWVDTTATYPNPNPTFTVSSQPNFHLPILASPLAGGGFGGAPGYSFGQII